MSDFLKDIFEIGDEEDVFLNGGQWAKFSEQEMDDYIETVFKYYREKGFPYYPQDKIYRLKRFKMFMGYDDSRIIRDKVVTQILHGLSLCWTYMPHSWGVKCGAAKYTPLDIFHDDDHLRAVIRKIMIMGFSSMGFSSMRGMVRIYRGAQSVSNFRPTSASAIYSHFCNPGDTVLDTSSGYGGRVLGAIKAKVNYIGFDPCTPSFKGVQEIIADWGNPGNTYNVNCSGSEEMNLPGECADFAFTSPPYFNTEKYSDEETQSWKKYPTRDAWLNGFLQDTIRGVHHALKPDRIMGINIAKVKSYLTIEEDCIRIAQENGFDFIDTWKYAMSNLKWTLPNKERAEGEAHSKFEPIFWFRKKDIIVLDSDTDSEPDSTPDSTPEVPDAESVPDTVVNIEDVDSPETEMKSTKVEVFDFLGV